jgi:hypothetical protein
MDHMAENEEVSAGASAPQSGSRPSFVAPTGKNNGSCDSAAASEKKLYPVKLIFYELPAEGKVEVLLYPFCDASWSSGSRGLGVAQISVEAPRGAVIPARRLVVNRNRISFATDNSCDELRLSLYLNTSERLIQGCIDLSTGGWVELRSAFDETNIARRGSFALMLEGMS